MSDRGAAIESIRAQVAWLESHADELERKIKASEAIAMASGPTSRRVCHHCVDEVSDPQVSSLSAECVETGESYQQPDMGEDVARRALADDLRAKLIGYRQKQSELAVVSSGVVGQMEQSLQSFRDGVIAGLDLALRVIAEVCDD